MFFDVLHDRHSNIPISFLNIYTYYTFSPPFETSSDALRRCENALRIRPNYPVNDPVIVPR